MTVTRAGDELPEPQSADERAAVGGATDPISKPVITEAGFAASAPWPISCSMPEPV